MTTLQIDARTAVIDARTAMIDARTAAIDALVGTADDFAERARLQEARRDSARPGTASHHQHAHSATLWRLAERTLRDRIAELENSFDA